MTLDEIRKWYDANKTHTMYEGHWCRTCSVGALLEELERLAWFEDNFTVWGCDNECVSCGSSYYNKQHHTKCEFVAHQPKG